VDLLQYIPSTKYFILLDKKNVRNKMTEKIPPNLLFSTITGAAPTLCSKLCIKIHPGQRRRTYAVIITFWDIPTLCNYSVGAPTL
jgi:hypothetical protein